MRHEGIIYTRQVKLRIENSMYQAELLAIKEAIRESENSNRKSITIHSVSCSSLQGWKIYLPLIIYFKLLYTFWSRQIHNTQLVQVQGLSDWLARFRIQTILIFNVLEFTIDCIMHRIFSMNILHESHSIESFKMHQIDKTAIVITNIKSFY